ncbi:MAG: cysteine desulfurase [Clostridiales bacterium]|jgi:cysteine desulfurase|nr:cysteine desulfurase [Clostridiales bacterium]
MIYFDNAATTRPAPEVAETVAESMLVRFGNPSSAHALGLEAGKMVDGARKAVAGAMRVPRDRLFFVASGSEANNTAIFGVCARGARRPGRIVTTRAEHASVLNSVRELESRGWQADYVGVDALGRVSLGELEGAIREDTALIALSHVNNETGAAQPLAEIARIRDRANPGAALFFDCVQSFCKLPLQPEQARADIVSISAHKIHGPKGVAALYVRGGLNLRPLIYGGGQEAGLRSGTENAPGICGFGAAAGLLAGRVEENAARAARLRERMIKGLESPELECRLISARAGAGMGGGDGAAGLQGVGGGAAGRTGAAGAGTGIAGGPPGAAGIAGSAGSSCAAGAESGALVSPYILCAAFVGVKAEVLLRCLSAEGVYVSSGSACASRHSSRHGGSHVLNAMGLGRELIDGAIRFSFSPYSTEPEVDEALERLRALVPKLRR